MENNINYLKVATLNIDIVTKIIEDFRKEFKETLKKALEKEDLVNNLLFNENEYSNTDTKINHLIPCSYFGKWKEENKKHREKTITLIKHNETQTIKLQDFKSVKFLIIQKIENLFNKIPFKDSIFSLEKIKILDNLQDSANNGFILKWAMHAIPEGVQKGSFCQLSKDKEELNKKDIEWNCHKNKKVRQGLVEKNLNINEYKLFMNSLKAKIEISTLGTKSYEITLSILKKLLTYINNKDNENIKNYESLYRYIVRLIFVNYLNRELKNIEKKGMKNICIFPEEQIKIKNFESEINVFENINEIKELIFFIIKKIEEEKKENTMFSSYITSIYYFNLHQKIEKENKELNYFMYYSKNDLKTIENPIIDIYIHKSFLIELLNKRNIKLLNNSLDTQEYTKVNMLAYSPNILIIESLPFFIEFLYSEFFKSSNINKQLENDNKIENFDSFLINFYNICLENTAKENDYWIIEKQK